ncbi:unnamed protein product [Haemonchus placei]|uniref:Uncharacterized protein n=1 Tax=Haemonchus placei TaxID=6290 RepID=A0A0N4X476_HAEPC|nr:unnamed protein product [Haemonchus placei]
MAFSHEPLSCFQGFCDLDKSKNLPHSFYIPWIGLRGWIDLSGQFCSKATQTGLILSSFRSAFFCGVWKWSYNKIMKPSVYLAIWVDAVLIETGEFLIWATLPSYCLDVKPRREVSSNIDSYGTTRTYAGSGTGPGSSAGSSQQSPILLMGDPIGDQGLGSLQVSCRPPDLKRFPGTARCSRSKNSGANRWTEAECGVVEESPQS